MKIISIQLVLFFLFNHANADDNFIKGKELFLSNKSACVSCHYISSLDDKNKKGMKWWEFYKDKREPTPDVEEPEIIEEQEQPPVIKSAPEKGAVFPNEKK